MSAYKKKTFSYIEWRTRNTFSFQIANPLILELSKQMYTCIQTVLRKFYYFLKTIYNFFYYILKQVSVRLKILHHFRTLLEVKNFMMKIIRYKINSLCEFIQIATTENHFYSS